MRHRTLALSLALTWGCASGGAMTNSAGYFCSDFFDMTVGKPVELRLLAIYTDLAASLDPDIEGNIAVAVDETNLAYRDSGIPINLVLAFTKQAPGPPAESTLPLATLVTQVHDGAIGNAPQLREDYHADIVALVADAIKGKVLENMLVPSMSAAPKAFLVVGYEYLTDLTLTHEIGHLLGAVHQRSPVPTPLPRYSYAFPHTCPTCMVGGVTGWGTIMATGTTRIPFFSNPEVLYSGVSTGTTTTLVDPEDNARTFANTAPIVAAFRYTPGWFVATGAYAPWAEKHVADDQLSSLAFADFDGDGLTDVFKIDPATKNWMMSKAGMGPWVKIGNDALATPLSELRFGDFDHDGIADAFRSDVGAQTWYVSWKSSGTWTVLNGPSPLIALMPTRFAFADFDGDKKTDVLIVDHVTGSWLLSSGGSGPPTVRSPPGGNFKFLASELRFGDFDGDGKTDVFRVDATTQTWYWAQGASTDWAILNGPDAQLAVPVSRIGIGDFNGDGTSDVLVTSGSFWSVAWAGAGKLEVIKLSCRMMEDVAFGDFDGDRVTDVFRTGWRP